MLFHYPIVISTMNDSANVPGMTPAAPGIVPIISTEELRASNDKLRAINEELRSATEELETSKEELQAVNEELIAVNYELKTKVEETGKANDDLNKLIASTDIATICVDSGLRIKRFTPRATDLFSIIASDVGRSLLDLTHRLDYDGLADDVGTTFDTLRLVEREVRSIDGRHYIVRLLPYRTNEDRIEGAVMTFFDITARREMASAGREQATRDDARSESALKDEFLSVLSHELRHPLNMININVELLSRMPEIRKSTPFMRAATIIRNAVVSQAKIIDDLMDMSRVRTGKLSLAMSPVAIGPLLQGIVEVQRADPATRDIGIDVVNEADGAYALADMVRVEQVAMNLLSNAVKFTPAGGRIEVRIARDAGQVRVDVVDSGQGIAPGFLPQVFDMYGQSMAVTTRSKGGLGIGLALVREIVVLHGGRVEAYSEGCGKGARFSFWLPLLDGGAVPLLGGEDSGDESMAGLRILVVDDMEEMLLVFKALLEMNGATVFVATGARRGLDILEHEDVDLVISDISMPEMDGYEFLRRIRANPKNGRLPVIAVSGLRSDCDIARARFAGFSAQLGKPVSIDRLNTIVHELLPRRCAQGRGV